MRDTRASLLLREVAFRLLCRHRQGSRPNVLLYCVRRGGSTWLLNTLAAHPGMRYVGRPFLTALVGRHAAGIPDLDRAAGGPASRPRRHVVGFAGEDEARFAAFAGRVLSGEVEVYPALNVRAPYFERRTDRIVFQMTSGTPLIEWFDTRFPVATLILLRHPIPTALSVARAGWEPECHEFLEHRGFVERHLDPAALALAREIERSGDALARHVLDWSLKMLVPLRALAGGAHPDWTVLTYEQTVVEPERAVRWLARRLDLPRVEPMLRQVARPSRTVSAATSSRVDDPAFVLERWRESVAERDERRLLAIPAALGLDAYAPGRTRAHARYDLPPDAAT